MDPAEHGDLVPDDFFDPKRACPSCGSPCWMEKCACPTDCQFAETDCRFAGDET